MTKATVLITGSSRGLGAAAARMSAELGANVVLMARSEDDLEAVAAEIRSAGGQALVVDGDVSVAANCQRAVAEAVERFGGLDAVVNNAGTVEPIAPIAEGDLQAWQENLAVNLVGPVMITQAALPHLRQCSGRVLNVSSGAAIHVIPGWSAYCVAKAGINHFTRAVAEEEPAVTAIAFRPGVVDTAMQATIRTKGGKGMPEEEYARFVDYYEEGELLPPELPGCALAVLALYAPHEWSGEFVAWNEERVQSLVRRYGCSPGGRTGSISPD
jgi:NAD(P)-dependent dehydrogenase (short-subunit alcohol dehydrogenase family)